MSASAIPESTTSTYSFGSVSHQLNLDDIERRMYILQAKQDHEARGCSTPSDFSSESLVGAKVTAGTSAANDSKSHIRFDVTSESANTTATLRLIRARAAVRDLVYQWFVWLTALVVFGGLFVGTLAIGYFSQLK